MSEKNNQNKISAPENEQSIRISEILYMCLSKWYWFLVSLLLAFLVAFFYVKFTPPTYERTASIMIKDDAKNSFSTKSAFAEIALMQTKTNVINEIFLMKSFDLMREVVKRLGLDVEYKIDGRFYDPIVYGGNQPINVTFYDLNYSETASFVLKQVDSVYSLSEFVLNGEKLDVPEVRGTASDTIQTPVGRLSIIKNAYYSNSRFTKPLLVSKEDLGSVVAKYTDGFNIKRRSEKASVIDLFLTDVSIKRADDILKTLIAIYNEQWIQDRNIVAVNTSNFIDERLAVIEKELRTLEDQISSYKSKNLLPNLELVSDMYMSQSSNTSARILELNTQISMAKYVKSYMSSSNDRYRLFPVNAGLDDSSIANQVANYNEMVLERNSLVANSSENNPLVADMDETLKSLHYAILSSIDEQINTMTMQLEMLKQTEAITNEKIAQGPSQARYLLSVERQQKVKEALYLFLLQKREENNLSQAFTAYNTRMINNPWGSMEPVTPVKKKIFLLAFVIGLMLPAGVIFLIQLMNNKVMSRKDIEWMSIPYVGEIPMSHRRNKHFIRRWKKEEEKREIVVKERSRNMINEAFRVVRTNFEFILGEGKNKVIMSSSMNPGSGKTFISMNLATAFAIKDKKVVLLDLDLRKAALSEFLGSPAKGVSDYLNGSIPSYREVLLKGTIHKNLDVIPVGTIPPNPAELLFEERLPQMIEDLKKDYDYVFIDCPPLEIVADSSIINKYVDMTIFIARADLLEKAQLPEVESFYREKKYKNMCMLLNGTETAGGAYGYHRYGYHTYGYHVYGYGSDKDEN